jgi:hypothetical protein
MPKRLITGLPEPDVVVAPPETGNLKTAAWRLALDLPVQAGDMELRLQPVECAPAEGRGKPAQFIPIRFTFYSKLTKDDRLLVGFDALVLSEALGRQVSVGKIIHGDDHAIFKVKVGSLLGTVRKLSEKMSALCLVTRICGYCRTFQNCYAERFFGQAAPP